MKERVGGEEGKTGKRRGEGRISGERVDVAGDLAEFAVM